MILLRTMPRAAKYALQPAMGTASSSSVFIAQSALPNNAVATPAITIRYGADGAVEPGPTSCQARR